MSSVMPDPEWESLTQDWKAETVKTPAISTADLHERVRRQNHRLALVVALEILITLAMIALSLFALDRQSDMEMRIAVGSLWIFILVVWIFALWNRRGVWQAQAQTTQAHLDLLYTRARRKKRTVVFCAALVIIETAAICLYRWGISSMDTQGIGAYDAMMLAAIFLGYGIWMVWYWRRARRELAYLEPLMREMREVEEDGMM